MNKLKKLGFASLLGISIYQLAYFTDNNNVPLTLLSAINICALLYVFKKLNK